MRQNADSRAHTQTPNKGGFPRIHAPKLPDSTGYDEARFLVNGHPMVLQTWTPDAFQMIPETDRPSLATFVNGLYLAPVFT